MIWKTACTQLILRTVLITYNLNSCITLVGFGSLYCLAIYATRPPDLHEKNARRLHYNNYISQMYLFDLFSYIFRYFTSFCGDFPFIIYKFWLLCLRECYGFSTFEVTGQLIVFMLVGVTLKQVSNEKLV